MGHPNLNEISLQIPILWGFLFFWGEGRQSQGEYQKNGRTFHRVTYTVTAMKESLYNAFVDEYKEGYGKADFDLADHFERRKEATLERKITYWFDIRKEVAPEK